MIATVVDGGDGSCSGFSSSWSVNHRYKRVITRVIVCPISCYFIGGILQDTHRACLYFVFKKCSISCGIPVKSYTNANANTNIYTQA